MAQKVPIADIDVAGSTQVRVSLSLSTIEDYAQALADGVLLPPVRLARTGDGRLYVIDGFHRIQAAKGLGRRDVDAEVEDGSEVTAVWSALAANREHGIRMTQADKARAIDLALKHPESSGMSDHAIAQHIGVRDETVTAHRERLAITSGSGSGVERGVTTDGRRHPRKNTRRKKVGRPKGSKNKAKAESRPPPEPRDPIEDVIDWDGFDALSLALAQQLIDKARARLLVRREKERAA